VGRPMFAMAWLTIKAALRYRLVQILAVLLLVAVVFLPAIVKHDGTARGFTQILLTYSMGSVTLLLGFATLWLACGTLARDVEECQMQMVAVKPIARWEIWLGKWLGLVLLNVVVVGDGRGGDVWGADVARALAASGGAGGTADEGAGRPRVDPRSD
jgi:ABC-type transport system involved in multi-copper enzyme maturation permease subunit